MNNDKFEAVIGLEVHAQIAVKSKMFCSCSSDSFDESPNTNVCPICTGFPGQLPVINEEAVKKGLIAALALNCKVSNKSKFDRKNYFYPDLPKGFQISQFDEPVAEKGWLEIAIDDGKKKIGITRLHLEDDAGKLTHTATATLCDYNRSGVPLMEIVSDPDIRSSKEAQLYAKMLQTILRYTGTSNADMEKGMMRFDASVSIRPKGETKLYPRAEIKNLNSFRSLVAAIDYEIERQIFAWKKGEAHSSDITVGWSDNDKKTYFLRDKEAAHDYRYFPEPDLPPLKVEDDFIERLKKEIPELPEAKRLRYIEDMGMSVDEALLISSDPALAEYFEEVAKLSGDSKMATTFISTILITHLKKDSLTIEDVKIKPEDIAELIKMIIGGKVSMSNAKGEIFEEMFKKGGSAVEIIEKKGLGQVNDEGKLEEVCKEVITENAQSIEDYKSGKDQAFFFLVGQVMKKTKGQANAKTVNEILKKLI